MSVTSIVCYYEQKMRTVTVERWRQYHTKIEGVKLTPMPNRNAAMPSRSADCLAHFIALITATKDVI